jgi:TonB family protein
MIDPFHLEAYGKTTVNYNRDIEIFPVLSAMFENILGESPYKSPTDMGVNMAGNCIVDDEITCRAAKDEIIRRYYTGLCDRKKGLASEEEVLKLDQSTIESITVKKHPEGSSAPATVWIKTKGAPELAIGVWEPEEEKKPELIGVVVKTVPDDPFDVVEQMPEFPGGMEALMKYLQESVKYPKEAFEKGIQGRVLVQFIVEKDGSISEVEVVKKVNEYLDAEAVRVVNAMPKWKPGMQKGKPVRVKFTLPITFRLS